MSRANVKAGEVDRMWTKLRFAVDTSRKDVVARLYLHGHLVLWTKRSHGAQKMRGNIPRLIRQQMHLDNDEFADAINCPLDHDGYVEILRRKGFLRDLEPPRQS